MLNDRQCRKYCQKEGAVRRSAQTFPLLLGGGIAHSISVTRVDGRR